MKYFTDIVKKFTKPVTKKERFLNYLYYLIKEYKTILILLLLIGILFIISIIFIYIIKYIGINYSKYRSKIYQEYNDDDYSYSYE